MAMPLSRTENAKENIVKATNPRIRIFSVSARGADTPQNNCDGVWNICSPDVAGRTSAVAYYFAEKLYMELKVPIGIIVSAVGGTPAEAWTPEEIVFSDSIISNNLCRELWNTRPSKPGVLYNWMNIRLFRIRFRVVFGIRESLIICIIRHIASFWIRW